MKKIYTLGCSLLILTNILSAQNKEPKIYPKKQCFTQKITTAPPSIDGLFDEDCWASIDWAGEYLQNSPYNGQQPTQDTKFKILYDEKYLYLAFRCFDTEPDKIVKRMSRRDNFPGDWVEINIDSNHDLRTAFSFTISVSGVKGDEFISEDGNNWDTNWNPIWTAKTTMDSLGWQAEVKIPLSQLRFSNEEEQIWGIQSTRRDFRKEERSLWQPKDQNMPGWVSLFGELHGIKGIKPQKQIELQPYVVTQLTTFPKEEGNPFADGSDTKLSGGLDGRIGITNDLSLDFTINPDFGQVEADPGALNLNGFQIFFSERRPFFIEGRNIFDYRVTGSSAGGGYDNDILFYSRRIGGSPHRNVWSDPSNQYYVDQPDNTTILGAAKFSGKTKKGLSIGILESITQKEVAKIDDNGENSETIVEPFTNYFIGRLRQDFNKGNTVVGGIFTSVNRNIKNPELKFLHKSAYSGGVDILHRWDNRNWSVSGKFIFSHVSGTKESITRTQTSFEHLFQRPDANHLSVDTTATSLTGHGGTLKLAKFGGNFRFETGATWRSPNVEFNDVGFLLNTDEINHFTWASYRWQEPKSFYRNIQINYNHWGRWDFSGKNLYRAANVNFRTFLKNYWNFRTGFTYENLDISKNALRGGPLLTRPNGVAWWVDIDTDQRKMASFGININQAWGIPKAVRVRNYSFWSTLQPLNALRISLSPSYNRFQRVFQYFTQSNFEEETRYLGGRVDQKTFSLTLRVNYNITPDLTIQYYGQPFISKGNYTNFRRITNPNAPAFLDRHLQFEEENIYYASELNRFFIDENKDGISDYDFSNPDFNFIQFRSNLVVRWEYKPGSELFLVWSQGTTTFDDPERKLIPSLTSNIFGEQGTNIFLVKATYRFLR